MGTPSLAPEGVVSGGQVPSLSQEGNRPLTPGPAVWAAVRGLPWCSQGGRCRGWWWCPGALRQPPEARSSVGREAQGVHRGRGWDSEQECLQQGWHSPLLRRRRRLPGPRDHLPRLLQVGARSAPSPSWTPIHGDRVAKPAAGGHVRGQVLGRPLPRLITWGVWAVRS